MLEAETEEAEVGELRERLQNAREGLRLLLLAWARYEDELPGAAARDRAGVPLRLGTRSEAVLEDERLIGLSTAAELRVWAHCSTRSSTSLSTSSLRHLDLSLPLEISHRVAAHPRWEMKHWDVPLRVVERVLLSELQDRVYQEGGRWSIKTGLGASTDHPKTPRVPSAPTHDDLTASSSAQDDAIARLALPALRSAFEPLSAAEIARYVGDHISPRLSGNSVILLQLVRDTLHGAVKERVSEVEEGYWRLRRPQVARRPS